mmetsp:Transcript_1511/g.4489  ORF Transcript_1511/g.4489 Transcript_1511/m.4489 type:complete len:259 (+) Transcript_1511:1151-1927(+)
MAAAPRHRHRLRLRPAHEARTARRLTGKLQVRRRPHQTNVESRRTPLRHRSRRHVRDRRLRRTRPDHQRRQTRPRHPRRNRRRRPHRHRRPGRRRRQPRLGKTLQALITTFLPFLLVSSSIPLLLLQFSAITEWIEVDPLASLLLLSLSSSHCYSRCCVRSSARAIRNRSLDHHHRPVPEQPLLREPLLFFLFSVLKFQLVCQTQLAPEALALEGPELLGVGDVDPGGLDDEEVRRVVVALLLRWLSLCGDRLFSWAF